MVTSRDRELRLDLDDFDRSFVLEVSEHVIYAHPVESDDEIIQVRKALASQGRKHMPLVYCDRKSVKELITT